MPIRTAIQQRLFYLPEIQDMNIRISTTYIHLCLCGVKFYQQILKKRSRITSLHK
jgi:hypothetical protein